MNRFVAKRLFCYLVISVTAAKCVAGQLCQESLPDQYDPTSDSSTTTSVLNNFYLYPSAFNDTQCVGTLSSLEYTFCYLNAQSQGRPETVFTVLLLRDDGDSYTVLDSYEEREDRQCDLTGNTCCKTVAITSQLVVARQWALGFVIPSDTGGNFLYGASTTSSGYQSTNLPSTAENSIISKLTLTGGLQTISNRRFSVTFETEVPLESLTTTAESLTTTTSSVGGNSGGSGSTNAGAVAAGVIIALLVVGAAVAIAIILIVLFLWRRQKQAVFSSSNGTGAFENQLYEVQAGTINGKSVMPGEIEETEYSVPHDYATVPINKEEYYEEMTESAYLAPIDAGGTQPRSNTVGPIQTGQSMKSVGGMSQRKPRGDTYPLPPVPGAFNPYNDTLRSMTLISMASTLQRGEELIYQDPAEDEAALYEQYQRINLTYIQKDHVHTADVLGSGQFGVVCKGQWMVSGTDQKINVAIKMLKDSAQDEDKVKFLQEAAIVGQFSHPNVVKLHGIVIGEQKMIVLELLQGGDLHHSLVDLNQRVSTEKVDADLPHTLLSYCRQIASGMSYLASKSFVHRDLAARNILLSEDGVCKITDFGMSRDLANTNYYVSHGGKIPVRWTAPEAINFHTYSTASDVWSFGCVMYEIWSLGHKPFEKYSNSDCIHLIGEGIRLPPPPGCPKTLYTLMIDCWHPNSSDRPNFVSVVQQLSLPDTKLLKWSDKDKGTADTEAAILGAGLDKSVDLYKDLQERYTS